MTGWRLGWCAAPEPIAKAIDAIQSHSTSNPTSFAQKGAVAALTGPQDHLPSSGWPNSTSAAPTPGRSSTASPASPASTPRARSTCSRTSAKTGLKSTEFCARLLEAEKVAAVPGIAFGADDYIRLSYATSMANIEKGLDRIERFCNAQAK